MRHGDRNILQQGKRSAPTQCAIWLVADGLRWVGETLEGISQLLLRKAGNIEGAQDSSQGTERVLLSASYKRIPDPMREIKIRCPGCFREVVAILEVEGIQRCDDCVSIAEDRDAQFQNSGLN